jgi:ABC-2 type transport system ATP-binding protein
MEPIITATRVTKAYGEVTAVDDLSLDVRPGEIFCIVGPNGAGKTTTVEMLQGLRAPDVGTISILGLDPRRYAARVRELVGTQLQSAVLPDRITVTEALQLYSSFYRTPRAPGELLRDWNLESKRDATFASLSGGQRQRLFIALALIGRPEIVFLDELTTGLDPQARRMTWEHIRAVRASGVTVVLVTHFMDEAEQLADRIAVVDGGTIIALDTPAALTRRSAANRRVTFTAPTGFSPSWLADVDGVEHVEAAEVVTVTGTGPLLARVAAALADHGAEPDDLTVERASLEDAFLTLTTPTA